MLYISPWAGFEPKTSVVIGTDCIGSCKSNYHTITPTTAPVQRGIELYITNLVMTRNFKTVMVNNYTNINTTNNHLWPQIFERKKDQYLWRWRFRFCFIFFFSFLFLFFIFFALGKREVVRMKVKRRVKFYIKMTYEKKQWWSSIPPIIKRTITSHLKSLNITRPRHMTLEIQALVLILPLFCKVVRPCVHLYIVILINLSLFYKIIEKHWWNK